MLLLSGMAYLESDCHREVHIIKGSVTLTVSLLQRGRGLPFGRMDNEIELILDAGFVCSFVPDFRVSSKADTSDYSAVCRRLSGAETSADMGILPGTISKKHSVHTTSIGDTDV